MAYNIEPNFNSGTINRMVYIKELASYLNDSFQNSNRIKINLLTQPVELDVALAIPIGLIINTAVTNPIKYAFPNGRDGNISIKFDSDELVKFDVRSRIMASGSPGKYFSNRRTL